MQFGPDLFVICGTACWKLISLIVCFLWIVAIINSYLGT
jgi:hypothetical protein